LSHAIIIREDVQTHCSDACIPPELAQPNSIAAGLANRVSPRILLFSRDRDFLTLYTAALLAEDFETMLVSDAEPLGEICAKQPCSVAMIDVLGREDWAAVDTCVRCNMPVIVVTGWSSPDRRFRDQAFARGAAAFILKPVIPSVVIRVVLRVLQGERNIDVTGRETAEGSDS
jgi:DNA-binding NtrC family response regulator